MKQRRDLVGHKVRKLRKENGMTQAELASRIGIIQSDLCRMEKGEYRVGLETLLKILQVFDVAIGDFFGEADGEAGRSSAEGELLRRFRGLSDGARSEVLDYVRFKADQEDRVPDDAAPTSSAG